MKCCSIRTKPRRNLRRNESVHVGNYDTVIRSLQEQNESIKKEIQVKVPDNHSVRKLGADLEELLNQEMHFYWACQDIQDKLNANSQTKNVREPGEQPLVEDLQ